MSYSRPKSLAKPLRLVERRALLKEYFEHYTSLAKNDPTALNQKLSRKAFAPLLDAIGALLVRDSAALATTPGPLREFLDKNPLPQMLTDKLPDDFRAFCLALNALKQWVAAEQAATDRYLLGGTARTECRAVAKSCVLSAEQLTLDTTDLHHPVRDGRPPIPLSKKAHAGLEGQLSTAKSTPAQLPTGSVSGSANGVVSYRSSRLLFRAKVIEALSPSDKFRVETPDGAFEMSKTEFYNTFPNVTGSNSYMINGTYGYSKIPAKALAFRVEDPIDNKHPPSII